MINKMNRSMVAKLPEEKKMESLLNEARNSEELKNYAENLRKELSKINIAFLFLPCKESTFCSAFISYCELSKIRRYT